MIRDCKESPFSLHSPIFLCRITETAALFSGVGFQYPYVDRPQWPVQETNPLPGPLRWWGIWPAVIL